MTNYEQEFNAKAAEELTTDLEQLSDRDKNFAAYIKILDRVEGLMDQLKAFEIPDREQRSYNFTMPNMTYSECPGVLGDILSLEHPLELDVTLTQEMDLKDEHASVTPDTLDAFYGLSMSISDAHRTIVVSRDNSVSKGVPGADMFIAEPIKDTVIPKSGNPETITRLSRADIQKIVLIGVGYSPESLQGIDTGLTNMFSPEKRSDLENILSDSCLSSQRVVRYEFPDQATSVSAVYQASSDEEGNSNEELMGFTINFGDPVHIATVSLDRGLEVNVSIGENTTPDSGEIVKFVEALNRVTNSIENRRPRVVTASPAQIQELETDRPDITLL